MASTLGDEYHGHKCLRAPIPLSIEPTEWERILHKPTAAERAEDEAADSLYITGKINRAEWLMAHERRGESWPRMLP